MFTHFCYTTFLEFSALGLPEQLLVVVDYAVVGVGLGVGVGVAGVGVV